jgi:hypothetical protein
MPRAPEQSFGHGVVFSAGGIVVGVAEAATDGSVVGDRETGEAVGARDSTVTTATFACETSLSKNSAHVWRGEGGATLGQIPAD